MKLAMSSITPRIKRINFSKVGLGACVTDAPSEYAGAELYER